MWKVVGGMRGSVIMLCHVVEVSLDPTCERAFTAACCDANATKGMCCFSFSTSFRTGSRACTSVNGSATPPLPIPEGWYTASVMLRALWLAARWRRAKPTALS